MLSTDCNGAHAEANTLHLPINVPVRDTYIYNSYLPHLTVVGKQAFRRVFLRWSALSKAKQTIVCWSLRRSHTSLFLGNFLSKFPPNDWRIQQLDKNLEFRTFLASGWWCNNCPPWRRLLSKEKLMVWVFSPRAKHWIHSYLLARKRTEFKTCGIIECAPGREKVSEKKSPKLACLHLQANNRQDTNEGNIMDWTGNTQLIINIRKTNTEKEWLLHWNGLSTTRQRVFCCSLNK